MTTSPGQEPRSAASRGGTARSRREAGSGWPPSGGSDAPRFRPSRAPEQGGGRSPREPRAQGGRGYGERPEGGRASGRELRARTDRPDSPRRPADRGATRGGAHHGPRDAAGRGPSDRAGRAGPRRAARPDPGAGELRAGPALRWIGTFPLKLALTVFFGAAVLGALATLVTGNGPGGLLANLILLGAVVAALGIERRSLYLLVPMPALTYLVLAVVTGAIHDSGSDTSTTQFGLNFLQWIGNGFLSLFAATVLVLLVFGARLLASRQLVSGSFAMSAQNSAAGRPAASRPGHAFPSPSGRPDPRRADRRRPSRPPWDDAGPWYDAPRDREQRKGRERDSRGDRERRPRPDGPRRAGERGDDGWRLDDRRPRTRNAPPDSGEPPTLVDPPAPPPRPGRDSRDRRDPPGGTPRSGRGSWERRDPRGR